MRDLSAADIRVRSLVRSVATAAIVSLLATVLVLVPFQPQAAAQAPSHTCQLLPQQTPASITQAGVPAVVPGETVQLTHELTLQTGAYYQQQFTRPDGTVYFGSAIEVSTSAPEIAFDLSSAVLMIDGVVEPLAPGVAPSDMGYVIDEQTVGGQTTWRILFPGDPTLTPDPEGVVSVQVTNPEMKLAFSVTGEIDVASTPGAVLSGVECFARTSTGASNQETDRINQPLGVVRPLIDLVKVADVPGAVLVPGAQFNYTLTASVPLVDPADPALAVAPTRNVVVVDVLPTAVTPIDATGVPLVDGAEIPSYPGSVWDEAAYSATFMLGTILPGDSVNLVIPVVASDALTPSAEIANTATASFDYLIDNSASPPNTAQVDAASAEAIVRVASSPPTITKSAPVTNYDRNRILPYTITVVLPPDSTYENFVVSDKFPLDSYWRGWVSESCVDSDGVVCPAFSPVRVNPLVQVDGSQFLAWNMGHVPVHPLERTMTFVVNADIRPVLGDWGREFENTAAVQWNAVDQFGVANPDPRAWPVYDGTVEADETVIYNRPVLEITKTSDRPALWDFDPTDPDINYTVTLTNTGSLPAINTDFWDVDNLRLDMDVDSLVVTNGTCDDCALDANGRLRGTLSDIAVGETVTIEYTAQPANTGDLINGARAHTYTDPEGTVYGPVAAATTSRIDEPALEITKTGEAQLGSLAGTPITFDFSVSNVSAQTALIPRVIDTLPSWLCPVAGDTIAAALDTATGYEFATELAQGVTDTFSATFEVCGPVSAGTYTNTAAVRWNDLGDDRNEVNQVYSHTDTHDFDVLEPTIEVTKTPNVGNPGVVDQTDPLGGVVRNGVWTVTVTNTSDIEAFNLSVTDPLPETMEYELDSATAVWSGTAYTLIDNSVTDPMAVNPGALDPGPATTVDLVITQLDPGDSVTITIPFDQSSVLPEPQLVTNTATVSGGNLSADIGHTASGQYEVLPLEPSPRVIKSVSPGVGGIGENVTYTIDVVLQGSQYTIHDIVVRDIIPDGMAPTNVPAVGEQSSAWTTWTATCLDGDLVAPGDDCGQVEFADVAFLGTRVESDPGVPFDVDSGETEMQFYIGDFNQAAAVGTSTQDTIIRITYTTEVQTLFSNGESVINGNDNEPLVNVVKAHFNRDDERNVGAGGLASGDVVAGMATGLIDPGTDRDRASPRGTALFDVVGPIVDFNKFADVAGTNVTVSGLDYGIQGDISLVDVGDIITYTVVVDNSGDGIAYDTVITDDLGEGLTTPVPGSIVAPAGTSCSFSGTSPETLDCTIDEIAVGGSATISYDVQAPTSPNLTGNPMRFSNTVKVVEFFAADNGTGTQYLLGEESLISLVYAPDPDVTVSQFSGPPCMSGAAPNDDLTFRLGVKHKAFDPPVSAVSLAGIADGYNPTLTVIIPASMSVDETTITATGPLAGDATYTTYSALVPDTATVNGDGTTTLEWTSLPNVPYSTADQIVLSIDAVVGDAGGSPYVQATLIYEDELGNTSRGDDVGAFAEYEDFDTNPCGGGGGGGGGGGPRPPNHSVSKTPDAGADVKLLAGVTDTFTITIGNSRDEITGVSLVDTLPQGILYLGADNTAADYAVATINPLLPGDLALEDFYTGTVTNPDGTHTVTWDNLPDLPNGTWTITFPVKGNSTIDEPETVQINTFTLNADQGPRADTGAMLVSNLVDPVITKTSNADQYAYDDLITYTVEVVIPADYQGYDLRVTDFINTPLGNSAYAGTTQIGRNGAEIYAEAPVKFENYVSAACISGCDIDDPDNPGNPDPDYVIDPVPFSPLPLATTVDYDPDNELVPDGSYSGQLNQATSGAHFTDPKGQRAYYYSAQNNAIGWFIGDVLPVPAGPVREDRVLEFVFQVRTPELAELEDAYVTQYDVGAIWTPARYNGPFTTNATLVDRYWDRTKRNTVLLRESNSATGDSFWDDPNNWFDNDVTDGTPNHNWYARHDVLARTVDQAIYDVHIQFPYVTIEKDCSGLNGLTNSTGAAAVIEPLVDGEARNASCVVTLTNQTGAPAYHLDITDNMNHFQVSYLSQRLYHSGLSPTYAGITDALITGAGTEFLTSAVGEFPLIWDIDQIGPNATIELEYSLFVDGWTNVPGSRMSGGYLAFARNTATLDDYLMVDDPDDDEFVTGRSVQENLQFHIPNARINAWPHPPQTTDISPHRLDNGLKPTWYAGWTDPLMPPPSSFPAGNHPNWQYEQEFRAPLGTHFRFWYANWRTASYGVNGGFVANNYDLLKDDVWSPAMVAELDEPYTWNINIDVTRPELFEQFEITDTLPYGWEYVPGSARIIDGDWVQRNGSLASAPGYRVIDLADPTVTASTATECSSSAYGGGEGQQLSWTFNIDDPSPRPIWDIRYLDRRDQNPGAYLDRDASNWVLVQFDAVPTFDVVDCDLDATTGGHVYGENLIEMVTTPRSTAVDGTPISGTNPYGLYASTGTVQSQVTIAPVAFPVSLSKTPDGEIFPDDTTTEFVIEFTNNGEFDLPNKTLNDTMVLSNGHDSLHVCGTAVFEFRDEATGTISPATGVIETSCVDAPNGDGNSQIDFVWDIDNLATGQTLIITVPLTVPHKDLVDGNGDPLITNATVLDNDVSVFLSEYDTTLADTGAIEIRFPSPPPAPGIAVITNSRPTINEPSGFRVQFTMPQQQTYRDLMYTATVPDGLEFTGFGTPFCNVTCPFDPSAIEMVGPIDNGDGTLTLGWFFNDVSSRPDRATAVYLPFDTTPKETYFDGSQVSPEHGVDHGPLYSTAWGFAHQEDLLDSAPSPEQATVTDPVEDPNTAGGSTFYYRRGPGTNSIYVVAPRIEVTKTVTSVTPDPANASSVIEYAVTIQNTGGQPAYNLTIEDIPGVALENVVVTNTGGSAFLIDGWTVDDPRMAWYYPTFTNGWTRTFRYTAEVVDDYADIPVSTADNMVRYNDFLALPGLEPAPGDRVWPAGDWIEHSVPLDGPNLVLDKFISDCATKAAEVVVNEATTWCLVVTNDGGQPALDVHVTDDMPAGWSYNAGSASVTGATLPDAEPAVDASGFTESLVWTIGDLGAGASVTIEFDATPGTDAAKAVTNTANAIAFLPDGDDADTELDAPPPGAAGFTSRSSAQAGLGNFGVEVTKSADGVAYPYVGIGGAIEWTIIVTNDGPNDLTDLVITDFLPEHVTYTAGDATSVATGFAEVNVGATGSGPNNTTEIVWTVPGLAMGDSFTITVPTTATAAIPASDIINDVEVTANELADEVAYQVEVEIYPISTLGDFVWVDANSNGIQDPTEAGLDGVVVSLRDTNGAQLYRDPATGLISTTQGTAGVAMTATTGDDPATPGVVETGWFAIENVRPGDYQMHFDVPATHTPTFFNAGSDTAADSDLDPVTSRTATFTVVSTLDDLSLDAGLVEGASGTINGVTWIDDGNGQREASESLEAGVTVELIDSTGTVIASMTTGPNGEYSFTHVPPGDYTLGFTTPADHQRTVQGQGVEATDSDANPTTGQVSVTMPTTGETQTNDAGYVPHASIAGLAWIDDGDGVRETDETLESGVTVNLIDANGVVIDTATTATGGAYYFGDVYPGDYNVEFVVPSDHLIANEDQGGNDTLDSDASTSTGRVPVTVVAGTDYENIDAGFVPPASIAGVAWTDDGDGLRAGTEGVLSGVTVELLDVNGDVVDSTTTGLDGAYLFDDLYPGDFAVRFLTPADHAVTEQDRGGDETADSDIDRTTGEVDVSVDAGEAITDVDAGYVQHSSISGLAWIDDGNGVFDPTEAVEAGVTVNLIDENGLIVATMATGVDGSYAFTELYPGDYSIEFLPSVNTTITLKDQGTNDADDSDIDRTTGRVDISLAANEDRTDIDGGFVPGASADVSGVVWNDDTDGVREADEVIEPGVTVNLRLADGTLALTTVTDIDGGYVFADVPPGDYTIEIVGPADTSLTFQDQGGDDSVDSDVDRSTGEIDFTMAGIDQAFDAGLIAGLPGTIDGTAWIDDGDGLRQPTEAVRSGVTVNLINSDGDVVATAITNATGEYLFVDVPPGDYQVEIVPPASHLVPPQGAGSDNTLDSDIDPLDNRVPVTMPPGGSATLDAGFVPDASIAGTAWIDDGDGIRQPDEVLEEGVTVRLVDANGTVIDATTTDPLGQFEFFKVFPGDYEVTFGTPADHLITAKGQGVDVNVDSDINTSGIAEVSVAANQDVVNVDAGYVPDASLAGVAWIDNGDGVREVGETLEEGITVNLVDANGIVVDTATTGPNGDYLFSDVFPGDYEVEFVIPASHGVTFIDQGPDDTIDSDAGRSTGRVPVVVVAGSTTENIDVGLVLGEPVDVSGVVWNDDGDNVRDSAEPVQSGVVVQLVDADGRVVDTTTTDLNGRYLFADVPTGDYSVAVGLPADTSFVFQDQGDDDSVDSDVDQVLGRVDFTVAGSDLEFDAGITEGTPASITGVVWVDEGGGVNDPGEPLVEGVEVRLINENGVVVATTTTGPNGEYTIANVPPGSYQVEFVNPMGHINANQNGDPGGSDPDPETSVALVTVASGETGEVDAGFVLPATIAGSTWVDENYDGTQDVGEFPQASVVVELVDVNGDVIATTTTDSVGEFEFSDVYPGDYTVRFVTPAGTSLTFQDQGDDDSVDSDVDRSTGEVPVSVATGETADVDAGFVPGAPLNVSGVVWADDGDGINETGEAPVDGVEVLLLLADGTVVAATTTDENGAYSFVDVPPGGYLVEVTTPADSSLSFQDQGDDDSVDSDVDRNSGQVAFTLVDEDLVFDAGITEGTPASITGVVWVDEGGGVNDPGEPPVEGVEVRLINENGVVVATTTTGPNGEYTFASVPPGSYQVEFVNPMGHINANQNGDPGGSDPDPETSVALVTVGSGETGEVDAGFVLPAAIAGSTWVDENYDGIQDVGEFPQASVVVELVDVNGDVIATTTTDSVGEFEFSDVYPGDYTVRFVTPAGTSLTFQDQGDDDSVDSDVDRSTGEVPVTVATGETADVDAGFVPGGSGEIAGTVWTDDGAGIREPGEAAIAGVTVELRLADGMVMATATTDANGDYLFSDLPPGQYVVEVVRPFGHVTTLRSQGQDGTVDSDVDRQTNQASVSVESEVTKRIDAGFVAASDSAVITGRYWNDTNTNGQQGAGEPGLPGELIELLNGAGEVVATTTTIGDDPSTPGDESGTYIFGAVPPGDYSVQFPGLGINGIHVVRYWRRRQ